MHRESCCAEPSSFLGRVFLWCSSASLTITWEICLSSCVVSYGFCGRVWCHTRPLPGQWQQVAVDWPTAGTAALRLGPPGRGSYCNLVNIFTLISFGPAKAISRITPLMVFKRLKNVGATVQDGSPHSASQGRGATSTCAWPQSVTTLNSQCRWFLSSVTSVIVFNSIWWGFLPLLLFAVCFLSAYTSKGQYYKWIFIPLHSLQVIDPCCVLPCSLPL